VPIIKKQELSKRAGAARDAESCVLVGVDQGSRSLHIEAVSVAPNARIPRRINPHTEVAIIVQEGKLDAILGRERVSIGQGDAVLAPGRERARVSEPLPGAGAPAVCVPNASGRASRSQHPGRDVGVPVGEGVVWLPITPGPALGRGTLIRDGAPSRCAPAEAEERLGNSSPTFSIPGEMASLAALFGSAAANLVISRSL
jgi:mannose-6-phosphate isomerase-like protein (cupin superfamily)